MHKNRRVVLDARRAESESGAGRCPPRLQSSPRRVGLDRRAGTGRRRTGGGVGGSEIPAYAGMTAEGAAQTGKGGAWGERRESNPRSPGPQPGVLTPRLRPPRRRSLYASARARVKRKGESLISNAISNRALGRPLNIQRSRCAKSAPLPPPRYPMRRARPRSQARISSACSGRRRASSTDVCRRPIGAPASKRSPSNL